MEKASDTAILTKQSELQSKLIEINGLRLGYLFLRLHRKSTIAVVY